MSERKGENSVTPLKSPKGVIVRTLNQKKTGFVPEPEEMLTQIQSQNKILFSICN